MGGQSSGSQTVTNRTEIDPVTQAWRQNIINAGGALYNQGTPAYYPGQTVVPFSDQTQSGMNYLQQHAMQGAPNLSAANQASGRALSGWNPAMPFAANAAAGGLSNNPAMQGLSQYGTGNNTYAQSLFNQAAGDVGNAVNAQFAQSGRYGNNAARTDTMTRGIGNLYNQMMTPLYEAERNRGLTAQQTMGSLYDSGANRQLQGAELFGGLYSQGNQDAARAQALLPGLFSYGQMPGQAMLDLGGMYEGQAQNYLDADRARYDYNASAPWDLLSRYSQVVSGMPDFSGSQSTQQGPGTNRLMSGLGGAATGAGIASALGATGPWGWAAAGLGGLLGLSDRRLKREIVPLGSNINGTPLYQFAYLWDAPGEKRIGVMADEAPAHAVHTHPSGYQVVDYGAL
jgi:hypothetical protein